MAFSERFMDSYPYEMGQMPYTRHPYHPCFGSGPQMNVEQPRVLGGYPSQCHHGCCNHGYFGGPGSRAAYPHCTQPSAPFSHHGGYSRHDAACPVPYEPEQYGYGPRNYGCFGSGCCSHSSGCGVKSPMVDERKPEVYGKIDADKSYPYPEVLFPNGQKKSEKKIGNETNDLQESAGAWPWLLGYDPPTRGTNVGRKSNSPNAREHISSWDGKVSSQPYVRPAERTMDRSGEAYPSKKVRTIEVKDMSKADQNENVLDTKGSLNSIGADNEPMKIHNKEEKPVKVVDAKMKKQFSDEEAVVRIQSVYRGYDVRKLELLNKLKKLANIREQAAGLEGRIQSLVTLPCGPIDKKQRLILEETIMSLLLKLDDVQGLPAQYREIRKSAARELTGMQERLDSLTSQKLEEVKEEEMSEPLEQCMDSNIEELKEAADGTKVECGNEPGEDDHQQQLMDQDELETAIPDQSTVSQSGVTEKEDHGEGLRDVEVTETEKAAMDVDIEVNPNAKLEVNLNTEVKVTPNHESATGCEVEAAEPSFSVNGALAECEEVDDADRTCPKSVNNEIPSEAQLESDVKTRGEAEAEAEGPVGMSVSSTEAPVNERSNEAQVESGGTESVTRMDSESSAVVMENDIPNGTGVESDVVEPETRVEGEVLDGTFSSPIPGEQGEVHAVEPETRVEGEVLDGTSSSPVLAEQGEVEGMLIENGDKLMKENEELRKLTERLIEATKEQSAVISDLNKRVDNLEKRLSAKQKAMKNKRRK